MTSKNSTNQQVLEHFATSGLDNTAVSKMKVSYIAAHGDKALNLPVPSVRIPYFDLNGNPTGFFRLRTLRDWIPPNETKPRKYMQSKGSKNHLYLPPLLDVSWSTVAKDTNVDVLITEGEKKAACGCVHGFATIGLGGVDAWRSATRPIDDMNLLDWSGRNVYVIFDSDIISKWQVMRACDALCAELTRRGAKVKVGKLPPHCGAKVGLDDFLMRAGKPALEQLLKEADPHFPHISELNEELALVMVGAKALIMLEQRQTDRTIKVSFAKPADISPRYANRPISIPGPSGRKTVNVFEHWLTNSGRRSYKGLVFAPAGCPPDFYNLWQGFGVAPQQGDCGLFLEHIRDNICQGDTERFAYVEGWMAHMVQKPEELPGTALVLMGKQGTGKSFFAKTLGALVPAHFVSMNSTRQLLGNFNAHSANKLLLSADEAYYAGDKAQEGAMKGLITDQTRLIEFKGRDAVSVDNFARVIFLSNSSWPVPAAQEERRFAFLEVSDAHMQDTAYFARIEKQMDKHGLAALLDYLMKVDLSGFNVRKVPKTQALLEVQILSLNGVDKFWYERLMAGCNNLTGTGWLTVVPCDQIYQMYLADPARSSYSRRAAESELGKALKKLVPGLTDRRPGGVREFHFPALSKCREAFDKILGQPIPWPAVEDVHPRNVASKKPKF